MIFTITIFLVFIGLYVFSIRFYNEVYKMHLEKMDGEAYDQEGNKTKFNM